MFWIIVRVGVSRTKAIGSCTTGFQTSVWFAHHVLSLGHTQITSGSALFGSIVVLVGDAIVKGKGSIRGEEEEGSGSRNAKDITSRNFRGLFLLLGETDKAVTADTMQ